MLHLVFSCHRAIEPVDPTAQRIAAKRSLWNHFYSILPALQFATYTDSETIDQLISDTVEHLHPGFTAEEIFEEVRAALITFSIPVPELLHSSFTTVYFSKLLIKLRYGQRKKADQNPG